ncbi:hypothetical protein [Roseateles albus]|uniref:Uncharacterized protein n=1 Tax=Roseateles albus TaxID=2987525 RepID=A0ABT5KJB1_9BURK|nr:hypothetical protein [Roseateles albus]MDC8773025.1 hypothetical protein [Roseateles albus]
MQLIIAARLVEDHSESAPVRLAAVCQELTTSTFGRLLTEGKVFPASAQQKE